jgi:exonuclease III
VKGNLQTCRITIYKEEYKLINKYMPVNTSHSTTVAQTLEMHMKTLPSDRKVLIGGDWNVALAVQDTENHTEKRTVLAQQITALMGVYKLTDMWRRIHPDSKQFTYSGKQASNPKSRLDRLYIPEQWLHLVAY